MHIPHFLLLAIMLDFSGCNLSLSLSFTHTHLYHHHHHHRKWLVAICLLFYGIIVGMLAPIDCNFFRQSCGKAQPLDGYVTMCVLRIIMNIKTKK